MTDIILILILLGFALIGILCTIRHFQHKSGCCGGASYTTRRKKMKHVLFTKTFAVGGIHCEHCKNRVEEVINDIDGAAGQVHLKKGELTVFYEKEIPDELIRMRVEKAGYSITARD